MIELQKYSKLEADGRIKLTVNRQKDRPDILTIVVLAALTTIILVSLNICYTQVDPVAFTLKAYEDDLNSEVMTEYLQFVSKYGRSYVSQYEHAYRYKIFKANYIKVQEHNSHEGVVPFTLEINMYADLTDNEF